MKTIRTNLLFALALVLLFLVVLSTFCARAAGPTPATQLQFPAYYFTSGFVTNVGTTETNLVQWSIPQQSVGTAGFMRITLFEYSPDAAAANHVYKTYIGGIGNPVAGGTALFTNTVVQAPSAAIMRHVVMSGALNSARTIGDSSTNSFIGFTTAAIPLSFVTTTNFLVTVTGAGQFSTNVFGLDGAILEVFTLP